MRQGFRIDIVLLPYDHAIKAEVHVISNGNAFGHGTHALDAEPLYQLARLVEDLAPSSGASQIADDILAEARARIEAKTQKALAELVQLQDAKAVYAP